MSTVFLQWRDRFTGTSIGKQVIKRCRICTGLCILLYGFGGNNNLSF